MAGRPTNYTPELLEAVKARVLKGAPIHLAAIASGIPRSTHYDWMSWGEEGLEPWCEYSDSLACARATFACNKAEELSAAMTGGGPGSSNTNTSSRQWLLERGFPDEFGKAVELRVRGDVTRQVLDGLREKLDPGAFAQVIEALAGLDSE